MALLLVAPAVVLSSSTKVVDVKPVDGHGGLVAGFTVAKTLSGGACSRGGITFGSEIVQGALTCTFGDGLYDPCWQEGEGEVARVLCIPDAWRRSAIRIVLTRPAGRQRSDGSRSLWALTLTSGAHCSYYRTGTSDVHGKRVNFGCTDGRELLGDPARRRGRRWTFPAIRYNHGRRRPEPARPAVVRTAYYAVG
jgi:hypothetical protein